ncbi:FecR family protein [Sphingomonas lycopersici]|uniref:FecR domain-containing protein n=1 Tax=Sphingomonas lycopersici TaxID=2951807 RepID=A0AA41Z496_9SPHN|nr:FecR domain-containing protein [Sphingomonas lycopersici]MCW6533260.1 FecR domain-containing protein [Sphingomonas lycopersici]
MTNPIEPDPMTDEAIAWAVRVGDPAFDDWGGFERWLSADPAHAAAYHAASAAEAEIVALLAAEPKARPLPDPAPAPVARPAWRRWTIPAAAALAAAVVGTVAVERQMRPSAPLVYETAAGAHRTVALADGSSAILNGATRLEASGDDARSLTLVHGQATFTVRHDEAHPFRVAVGGASVVDVGTRFDIVRDARETRIAVSEGAVDWQRDGNSVRLNAGRSLRVADGSSQAELADVAPDTVGGWAQGQLSFDGVSLAEAAADLSRTLGTAVAVDAALARRSVRATVRLDGGAARVMPRFAALTGVRAVRDGAGWRLAASP